MFVLIGGRGTISQYSFMLLNSKHRHMLQHEFNSLFNSIHMNLH